MTAGPAERSRIRPVRLEAVRQGARAPRVSTLVVSGLVVLAVGACGNDPDETPGRAGSCNNVGPVLGTAKTFDALRSAVQTELAPQGTSEVIRGEGVGVIVNVDSARGGVVTQFVARYVDPDDTWVANEYLSCPG